MTAIKILNLQQDHFLESVRENKQIQMITEVSTPAALSFDIYSETSVVKFAPKGGVDNFQNTVLQLVNIGTTFENFETTISKISPHWSTVDQQLAQTKLSPEELKMLRHENQTPVASVPRTSRTISKHCGAQSGAEEEDRPKRIKGITSLSILQQDNT